MGSLGRFISKIWRYRAIILAMAVRQIRSQYVGSLGGILWAVICPLITMATYWFVFSVGLKVQPVGGYPFALLLLCAFVPWMTFSEVLISSLHSITGNAALLTKTVFPSELLPVISVVAGLMTHAVLVILLVILLLFCGVGLSACMLQIPYYMLALAVFSLGLGWLVAGLHVFWRDVGHILGVVINVWFWLTPIVWFMPMIPEPFQGYLKLNPMYYIVEGYRGALLYQQPLWQEPGGLPYFWVVSLATVAFGGWLFKKLKWEFADVL